MREITLSNGAWPTMITPFTKDNNIDKPALKELVKWYINEGADGLFAVCQSSEMFNLSLSERVELAGLTNEYAKDYKKGIQVIASGHISYSPESQLEEIKAISETGIDSFVLVSNRLAREDESEEVFKKNVSEILEAIPDICFGIYECPFPYKRIISPELLRWCADTGRFTFLKDTSCSVENMRNKLQYVKGTSLKLFNANSATFLDSLKIGASGFSGVMANFHLKLYHWLVENWENEPEKAQKIQDFIGITSVIESQLYPVCGKYNLQLSGIPMEILSRTKDKNLLTESIRQSVEQLHRLSVQIEEELL